MLIQVPVTLCNCVVLQSWNAWFRSRFCHKRREIPAPVLMDTVMGSRALERLHLTFRKGVPFNNTTNFFIKWWCWIKPAKYLLNVHKWKQRAVLFRKGGTVRCWGGRISHARASLITMRRALCMMNWEIFPWAPDDAVISEKTTLRSLPIAYWSRGLFKWRSKETGVKGKEIFRLVRFPTGTVERVTTGQFRTYGSNICLRYALEALEKRPKTIPTTTFTTATSEKPLKTSHL